VRSGRDRMWSHIVSHKGCRRVSTQIKECTFHQSGRRCRLCMGIAGRKERKPALWQQHLTAFRHPADMPSAVMKQ
jgi:hypothetical protein